MSIDSEQMIKDTFGKGFDNTALGLVLDEVTEDAVLAHFEIGPQHHQPFGIVHGGVYCAVAESVASCSAFTWLHAVGIGGTAVGVNNNTDFIKSVSTGTVAVVSSPIHRGRRQQLWKVTMTDDQGKLVATSQVRLQNIELPAGVEVPTAGGA
ncbi:PaaI family thioesterase [Gordonia sp. CPCC 205515]|uniref:PaaI family thioesterase n=1 Tax=Gordonia sp. CPCC 205515 TaxID=3140791 RepID=UPI003AF3B84B